MSDKTPQYVRYLWDDLEPEVKDKYLERAKKRMVFNALKKETKVQRPSRYRPFEESDDFWTEIEGVIGLNLDDGWFRLCCLHQYQTLVFNIRERYQAEWTSVYSKNAKATKAMREWPNLHKHTLKWKHTVVHEVQMLRIEWFEDLGQYKVEFRFPQERSRQTPMSFVKMGKLIKQGKRPYQGPPEPITQTFWFYPQFKDSSLGEGWVTPKRINKTVPLPSRR